jgi:hypothetical protein
MPRRWRRRIKQEHDGLRVPKKNREVRQNVPECEHDETNPDPDLLRNRGRVVHA